jgi:hypothetical protein
VIITDRQMQAFREAAKEGFITRLLQHLAGIGWRTEDDPRRRQQFIEDGIRRAQNFGVFSEIDVARFVVVTLVLGEDFDRNPNLPWVKAILNYRHFGGPDRRIRAIYDAARRLNPS